MDQLWWFLARGWLMVLFHVLLIQCRFFPPQFGIMDAGAEAMLVTMLFRRSTGTSAQLSSGAFAAHPYPARHLSSYRLRTPIHPECAISMGWCKKDVTPLLTHWRCLSCTNPSIYVVAVGNASSRRCLLLYEPLARYVKLRVAHAPGMPGTFSPPPQVSDPDMHHDTCVTHVPRCMPGSLISGFLWSWWRGKHSRCMHNPQFYVSGKEAHGERWWLSWHEET